MNVKFNSSIAHTRDYNNRVSKDFSNYVLRAGSQVTVEKFCNNEFRITVCSRLSGKNGGDTWQERKLELTALKIELEKERLTSELADKRIELFKIRKKYQRTGELSDWEKMATLELEIRELEYLTTGKDSEYFQTPLRTSLGITKKMQELKLARQRDQVKKDFTDPRKPNKLSSNAKHKILENCTMMDRLYGENQYLITLTVPGNTPEIKKAVADYSAYIDNLLYQRVRDIRQSWGRNIDYVGVWENQKSGKLHKHIVIGSDNCSDYFLRFVAVQIGGQWENILDSMATFNPIRRGNYSGCLPGLDMYQRTVDDIKKTYPEVKSWSENKKLLRDLKNQSGGKIFVNIQRVRKSVARYLAKYLSKGDIESRKKDNIFNPVRWWQSSKNIKDEAKAYRLKCTFPKDLNKSILLHNAITHLENTDAITLNYQRYFDIYAVLDSVTGKSKRVNVKLGEPIPVNSRRVAGGVQFIMYYDEKRFNEIDNFLEQLIDDLSVKPKAIPANKPSGKIKKYNPDLDSKFDYRKWKINHKNYWLEIIENSA
jgi:hypothetical protein